jgi:hypothetical protein
MPRARQLDGPVADHCKHRKLNYCPSCAAALPRLADRAHVARVGAPRKTLRTMHLEGDYQEARDAAREFSKRVTAAFAKNVVPPRTWAELTVDFADSLLDLGFGHWFRRLGVQVDRAVDRRMAERLGEMIERAPVSLKINQSEIDRANEELRRDKTNRAIYGVPMSPAELKRRLDKLEDSKNAHETAQQTAVKIAAVQRRVEKHEKHLRKRREGIVGALMGTSVWRARYWPFAVVGWALWRRIPPRGADDLHPPEKIAEFLAGLAQNLAPGAVGTTLDRLRQLGSIDAGAGPFQAE